MRAARVAVSDTCMWNGWADRYTRDTTCKCALYHSLQLLNKDRNSKCCKQSFLKSCTIHKWMKLHELKPFFQLGMYIPNPRANCVATGRERPLQRSVSVPRSNVLLISCQCRPVAERSLFRSRVSHPSGSAEARRLQGSGGISAVQCSGGIWVAVFAAHQQRSLRLLGLMESAVAALFPARRTLRPLI